jgi:hypothetical protein
VCVCVCVCVPVGGFDTHQQSYMINTDKKKTWKHLPIECVVCTQHDSAAS